MTRLPLLLSLAALTLPAQLFAGDSAWGTLVTRFVYDGRPPRPKPLRVTRDRQAFPGPIRDESLLVNPNNRGVANVVVYLLPAAEEPLRVHPSYTETANARQTLVMQRGRFEPHVLLMRTSQTMIQQNLDKVAHHAQITFLRNTPM